MENKIVMLECCQLPQSNQHLPEPFKIGEKVIFVEEVNQPNQSESFNRQFIRIKRLGKKMPIISENRNCFKPIGKPKI